MTTPLLAPRFAFVRRHAVSLIFALLPVTQVGCRADAEHMAPSAPTAASTEEPVSVCKSARDCAFAIVDSVSSETECACPRCPNDSTAITRSELDARKKTYQAICGKWAKSYACPPRICSSPAQLVCTEGGTCGLSK